MATITAAERPAVRLNNGTINPEALEILRAKVQGTVLTADDAGYDAARQTWNTTVQQRPAVIVLAERAGDVMEAVSFARAEGLGVAMQSTGHGVIQPADDALLIVTARMTGIHIDPAACTAWVEAGAQWGDVLAQAQQHGLAPLLGSSPNVGVVGYTLGGGMGWLARKYGLALDSVHYFEVVTSSGALVRASKAENNDLFWGLRGGGGNFGVITGMQIQLYPVTTIYGGALIYPLELAKAALLRYRDWIADAPDALTSSITIMNFPPLPVFPEPLRGETAVIVRAAYAGPTAEGEAQVQKWLDWMPPIINTFRAMPFAEVASISQDPLDPSPSFSTSEWLSGLSDETIDTLVYRLADAKGRLPLAFAEIRHAGGAMARVDAEEAAYSNRDKELLLHFIGLAPSPEVWNALVAYTALIKAEIQADLSGGVYMNFMDAEEALERTSDAYLPAHYRRLMKLKAKYDHENVFRFSFRIPALNEA